MLQQSGAEAPAEGRLLACAGAAARPRAAAFSAPSTSNAVKWALHDLFGASHFACLHPGQTRAAACAALSATPWRENARDACGCVSPPRRDLSLGQGPRMGQRAHLYLGPNSYTRRCAASITRALVGESVTRRCPRNVSALKSGHLLRKPKPAEMK